MRYVIIFWLAIDIGDVIQINAYNFFFAMVRSSFQQNFCRKLILELLLYVFKICICMYITYIYVCNMYSKNVFKRRRHTEVSHFWNIAFLKKSTDCTESLFQISKEPKSFLFLGHIKYVIKLIYSKNLKIQQYFLLLKYL